MQPEIRHEGVPPGLLRDPGTAPRLDLNPGAQDALDEVDERCSGCVPYRYEAFENPDSSEELTVNWNKWIRQIHRWLSIIFTDSVIVTFIALSQEKPIVWVSYVPLLPLALLLVTGLYLFVLPYLARSRGGQAAGG